MLFARLSDKMEAARRGVPAFTGFLSETEQAAAERFLQVAGHPRHLFAGGWPEAERKVCALLPDWQEEQTWEPPFTALRCRWQSQEKLTHRDFLGAVLGQGLEREKVGDILVRTQVCDLLVFRELVSYLLQNLTSAGRVRLQVEEIALECVEPPERNVKTIRDTVSSLRLDAVMASGFPISRTDAAWFISSGRVELNHTACVKPDHKVEEGDVITCRGFGKCKLTGVGGVSRKGRTAVTLERYS